MSEITLKVTMPVLEELAKTGDFVLQLSHAAAKEISEKYGDAIIKSAVVQQALKKLDEAIVNAQVLAGSELERKIGEWDNSYRTGYRLRTDVVKYIETHFQQVINDKFNRWIESSDVGAMLDKAAQVYVEQKVAALLKKELGNFLRERY